MRKMKSRGGSRKIEVSSDESTLSEASDELYELFQPELDDEYAACASSSSEHLDSDASEYVPRGRNAKRAAAIKGNFRVII